MKKLITIYIALVFVTLAILCTGCGLVHNVLHPNPANHCPNFKR